MDSDDLLARYAMLQSAAKLGNSVWREKVLLLARTILKVPAIGDAHLDDAQDQARRLLSPIPSGNLGQPDKPEVTPSKPDSTKAIRESIGILADLEHEELSDGIAHSVVVTIGWKRFRLECETAEIAADLASHINAATSWAEVIV